MAALAVGLSAAGGLVAGAFVPLPAHRLSVAFDQPVRNACLQCGHGWPAGVPGWLRLPPRCPSCAASAGPPAWATALITGAVTALLAAALGPVPALPLYAALAVLGVLLGVVDIACRRLPRQLVVPAIWISLVLFTGLALITGEWADLGRAVLGAAGLGLVFLLLYLLPGRGIGFGDVNLAVLLGLYLGWLGWRAVVLGGLLPWLVNAPVVIGLLLAGRVDRRGSLPFGPAMLTGALVAILVSGWVDVFGRT